MNKAKVDREKLFQIFCVYLLALVASFAAGESLSSAKRAKLTHDGSSVQTVQAPAASSAEVVD